jgi:hypothetical protein
MCLIVFAHHFGQAPQREFSYSFECSFTFELFLTQLLELLQVFRARGSEGYVNDNLLRDFTANFYSNLSQKVRIRVN